MRRRVAARLGQAIIVLWLVTTLVFVLLHAAPGDPFDLESPRVTEAVRAQLREQFGYNRPLPEQYLRYLSSVARGHLGYSHSMHRPVSEVLAEVVPRTLLLMGISLSIAFALGVTLALFQARYPTRWRSRAVSYVALLFYSLPDFWLSLVLLLTFGFWIPLLPTGGTVDPVMHDYMSFGPALWDRIRHLILPATTLTLLATAGVARFQKAELLEVLSLDFIRTARAKGLPEGRVLRRHALRNALIPMITLAGLLVPALLGGSVFIEKVFSWQGVGYTTANAIVGHDYPLVQASVLFGALMVTLGSLLADLAYIVADPRLRAR